MTRSQKRYNTTQKRMDKPKRMPYCTGCGNTFLYTHLLIHHRRKDRCGGRFLCHEEMLFVHKLRTEREALLRKIREDEKLEASY